MMVEQIYLNSVLEWLMKCAVYFLPVLLLLVRYNSFYISDKKPVIDIIVDDQFCLIPFCFGLETMITLLNKWSQMSENMRNLYIFLFVCLLGAVIILLLLYWDITFAKIQKNVTITSKAKNRMKYSILGTLVFVFALSFCVNVIIF